ncbi:MAG: orotate phosphoribosyltransferase [Candidatus Ancillula sp.]|nr:orotate phosphoribosyltransferase [Candidatus Ancillula sp.]
MNKLNSLDPREQLIELVNDLAVVKGDVVLSSGKHADYYIDLRRITLHHQASPIVGHLLLDLLEENGFIAGDSFTSVGGLTMGADPVACSMLHAAYSRGIDLDAFLVRKNAKEHGMQRQIEGPDIQGRSVIIVEDTTTTGNSPIAAIEAARNNGAEVVACATIVDRATGASQRIEDLGIPYFSLLSLHDIKL